jgi:hypothetical protein
VALGYSTTQASSLVGVVAIGTAAGAVMASVRMKLTDATRVMALGIAMGLLILVMNFINNVWIAAPFFILLGGLGGFLVTAHPLPLINRRRGATIHEIGPGFNFLTASPVFLIFFNPFEDFPIAESACDLFF